MNITTHKNKHASKQARRTQTAPAPAPAPARQATTASAQAQSQAQAHKHKHKRNDNGRNEEHKSIKQAYILHHVIVCYNAIFYQTKKAGTKEGRNEEKRLSILPVIETEGKRENRPRIDGRRIPPPVYSYDKRFSPQPALSYPLQPSHLAARFSSSRQTVQYVLCSRSHPVHYWSSAGSALQQVKSN